MPAAEPPLHDQPFPSAPHLARRTLAAFVLTFLAARIVVLLIMLRVLPDLFLFVGQTHVHHLNYGIFLLCATGAATLFLDLTMRHRQWAAIAYGVGLALTFDEFGMWLHLGGSYWQRASYDAVVVVAGLLGLIIVGPSMRRFHSVHWATAALIALSVVAASGLAIWAGGYAGKHLGPVVKRIELGGPEE